MPNQTLTERALIEHIRKRVDTSDQAVVKGIGDDCAVLQEGEGRVTLLTTDTLVEKIHYDPNWHPPYELGRKSVNVNISDIAAMGGTPRFALLSLALTPAIADSWFEQFMAGFSAALAEHNVLLVGGDTVRSGHESMISVTVIGEAEEDKVLYRSGAQEGDTVWVSGRLGEAAAGLSLCSLRLCGEEHWQRLIKAHLDPVPQVKLGQVLAASGLVHAMMDISDGLATDLAHICAASNLGAEIDAVDIPIAADTVQAASRCHRSALNWAIKGGEDYQLLFTCAEQDGERLQKLVKDKTGADIYQVARLVECPGVALFDQGEKIDITFQGYEHFR